MPLVTKPPPVNAAAASSLQTYAGTIAGGNSSQFYAQFGTGCGYVNVSTTSTTTWAYNGLTVSPGVAVTISATGSCSTSFVASQITLGTASASPTPSPTPTASPVVSGTISFTNANQITIQGGPGCGFVNVNYSSSTAITYNGLTLSPGVLAYVWGTGSCATAFAATQIALGALPTSAPSASPATAAPATAAPATAPPAGASGPTAPPVSVPSPTAPPPTTPPPTARPPTAPPPTAPPPTAPPPTAPPASGFLSAQSFSAIVNGQAWPSSFRPYCANVGANPAAPCPFNDTLPDNPSQLYANSASIVASMFGSNNHVTLPGDFSTSGDVSHPVYVATANDPLVTVTCTQYCTVRSASFYIPSRALPAGGSDHHFGIIQPNGTEWDMWHASYSGGTTATAGLLAQTSVLGSGVVPGGGATSGSALGAGMIRFDELARGVIPHALFATTTCTQSIYVYPGGSNASACSSNAGGAPPVGARLQLTLTDNQINALGAQAWEKAILHAMHDYGVYILDTNGSSSAPGPISLMWEAVDQFTSFGQLYPGSGFPGLVTGTTWSPGGISWAQSMRVLSPCYAQELCTQ